MEILIVANSPARVITANAYDYDAVIALDGAGNYFEEFDFLIGDLDSFFNGGDNGDAKDIKDPKIIHVSDQTSTDLHKGIHYADSLGATHIDITNAFGGRADHAAMNIRTLKLLHSDSRSLRLIDSSQSLTYYENCNIELDGEVGEHIGILSAPEAIVNSNGLKYDMKNTKLEWGVCDSSSNSFAKEKVFIKTEGGILVNQYL